MKRAFDAAKDAQTKQAVTYDAALLMGMAGIPSALRPESCMVSIAAVVEGVVGIDNRDNKAPAARDECRYRYDPAVHCREVLLAILEAGAESSWPVLC